MNELYHFGIKGMHWGIRRFETKGGHLTPAGKSRYDTSKYSDKKREKFEKRAAKYRDKAQNTDRTIKELSKYKKTGITDRNGKTIVDKKSLSESIKGYRSEKNKANLKSEYYKNRAKGGPSALQLKVQSDIGRLHTKEGKAKLKKAAKIGAGAVAVGLAIYGGYKLGKYVKSENRKIIARDLADSIASINKNFDSQIEKASSKATKDFLRNSKIRNIEIAKSASDYKMKNDSLWKAVKQVTKDRRVRRVRHFDFDDEGVALYHYGVKGMHWGVRHDRPSSGSSKPRKVNTNKSSGSPERKEKIKKALKIGAGAAAIGLALYGSYRLGKGGFSPPSNVPKLTTTVKKAASKQFNKSNKIPKTVKDAVKAGKEGFKSGFKRGVSSSANVVATGATMAATEYLLRRRFGDERGRKVFSYGRQPIKKK